VLVFKFNQLKDTEEHLHGRQENPKRTKYSTQHNANSL